LTSFRPSASSTHSQLYSERQMIVEHPFGTIKRIWAYNHFLPKAPQIQKKPASL
jgi:hypothetical protein